MAGLVGHIALLEAGIGAAARIRYQVLQSRARCVAEIRGSNSLSSTSRITAEKPGSSRLETAAPRDGPCFGQVKTVASRDAWVPVFGHGAPPT